MSEERKFTLEYWIDSTQFTTEQLENHVRSSLNKFISDVEFNIKEEARYLKLCITSTAKIIDACHDNLGLKRDLAFRAKDELGDSLRAEAYPYLAEIEVELRRFISRAMIEVVGFDWWNSSIPDKHRAQAQTIEKKLKSHQAELHHAIELTFFEDLIGLVTAKFQEWSDEKGITASDLLDLLSTCNSIEDIREQIEIRRKAISLWDDIFSSYFSDQNDWIQLEQSIKKIAIPVRNQVMHHRLVRLHEVRKVMECRDQVKRVLDLAKPELSDAELEEVRPRVRSVLDSIQSLGRLSQLTPSLGTVAEVMRQASQPSLALKSVMESVGQMPQLSIDLQAIYAAFQPSPTLKSVMESVGQMSQLSTDLQAIYAAVQPSPALKSIVESMGQMSLLPPDVQAIIDDVDLSSPLPPDVQAIVDDVDLSSPLPPDVQAAVEAARRPILGDSIVSKEDELDKDDTGEDESDSIHDS